MKGVFVKRKLLVDTVIRLHPAGIPPSVPAGSVWLMNRQEGGFAASGLPYATLCQLLADWDIKLGRCGEDEHGSFIVAEAKR